MGERVLQTHSHPNCPFIKLFVGTVFCDQLKLSPNCLIVSVHSSLSNMFYLYCLFLKASHAILCDFSFFQEWPISFKISAKLSIRKFHLVLNLFIY